MERIENIGFGDMKLVQDTEEFCYGVDAVILADFAYSFCSGFKKAVDLGTGTGIVPFILSHKNRDAEFVGIDVQESSIRMAEKGSLLNSLQERISFVRRDVSDTEDGFFEKLEADMVTCNPPYFAKGGGIPSENMSRFIARHETSAGIEDFVKAAASILKGKGHLFIVHRPSRLVDIFCACRKYGLEPKDIRYVKPRSGEVPNIVLIHCKAGGGRELRIMNELCVYNDDGSYSDEIQRIYERRDNTAGL